MPKPLDHRARQREHDAKRRAEKPWRAWYGTARWKSLRKAFLSSHPHCAMCEKEGRITLATVVNHKTAHRGDERLFWDQRNWEPLCKRHHDSDAHIIDNGGRPRAVIGVDGWPFE